MCIRDRYYRNENNQLFHLKTLSNLDNYQLKTFEFPGKKVRKIRLESSRAFNVFEIGFLKRQPFESITFDFFKPREIGWLLSRHLSGNDDVKRIEVYTSNDLRNWELISELNPSHIGLQNVILENVRKARYLKYKFCLEQKDYAKANLWEVDVFDQNGPFGALPSDEPANYPLKDMMGVNVFWGMGDGKYSDEQGQRAIPALMTDVFSHFRSYHNMDWDVTNPSIRPDYAAMKFGNGKGTMAWVDWDKEYGYWKKLGYEIQAAIQFIPSFNDPSVWGDVYSNAYNFAYDFTRHFGPGHGNNTVSCIEIGNEPWEMSNDLYQEILSGMLKGAKDADPAMEVLPCALRSGMNVVDNLKYHNQVWEKLRNEQAIQLDGVNCHYYSYFRDDQEIRKSVWPEHAGSSFRGILNEVKYRNSNFPAKPLYVTEFGWDSKGGGADCVHAECVSEHAQAVYAVRAFLILNRFHVKRAYWFFYANEKMHSTVYSRSGLFCSKDHHFNVKQSFYALKNMRKVLGDAYFQKVIEESDRAYCYQYGKSNGQVSHLVIWRPVDADESAQVLYEIPRSFRIKSILLLDGNQQDFKAYNRIGSNEIRISSTPLVVEVE